MKKKCNTLIWLGVGTGSNPSISFEEFERVITVEASPSITLSPQFTDSLDSKIEMHRVCLIPRDNKSTTFNVYNVEDTNSLDEITGMYDVYPNIEKISEEPVQFEFVTAFLNKILFDENTSIQLVVDIPDVSISFVEDIIQSQIFSKVSKILLMAPRFKVFKRGAVLTELLALFEENVDIKYEIDKSDPDFPICHIEIDQSAFEKKLMSELQTQLQQMTLERDKQKQLQEDNLARAESLKHQLEANDKKLLGETSLRVKAEQELAANNLQGEVQKVETECVLNEIEEKLLAESSLRVESENALAQKELQINVLKSKLDKSGEELTSKLGKLKEADRRVEQMLTMQTMNMRLLQKSESDNANLRERIANNSDQIESMTALLTELHEKLKLAANFYEQLTVQHPELLEKPSYE